MGDRDDRLRAFLDENGWGAARAEPLAGDASNRRYLRLTGAGGERAVVMDAPPARGEDVRPFLAIARFLTGAGFSAPRVLAAEDARGFLLLEDLGDALFARVLDRTPEKQDALYAAATDLLIALRDHVPPAGLLRYDPDRMTDLAALAFDWYAGGAHAPEAPDPQARASFCRRFHAILSRHVTGPEMLVQRDYHAENLLWLPDRDGVARVGLLDFQDAMLGHPAYDLVSLLQDARRDVPEEIEARMLARYTDRVSADPDGFAAAYACLGAQRNLRILGVFARLCLRDGKPGYLRFIPRVHAYLQRDLAHPALTDVRGLLEEALPAPTPETLDLLERSCATRPNP